MSPHSYLLRVGWIGRSRLDALAVVEGARMLDRIYRR
jgi:hypothetical protein